MEEENKKKEKKGENEWEGGGVKGEYHLVSRPLERQIGTHFRWSRGSSPGSPPTFLKSPTTRPTGQEIMNKLPGEGNKQAGICVEQQGTITDPL